jgi:transposase-like protein
MQKFKKYPALAVDLHLSHRMVEELLGAFGIEVTDETIARWVINF